MTSYAKQSLGPCSKRAKTQPKIVDLGQVREEKLEAEEHFTGIDPKTGIVHVWPLSFAKAFGEGSIEFHEDQLPLLRIILMDWFRGWNCNAP